MQRVVSPGQPGYVHRTCLKSKQIKTFSFVLSALPKPKGILKLLLGSSSKQSSLILGFI